MTRWPENIQLIWLAKAAKRMYVLYDVCKIKILTQILKMPNNYLWLKGILCSILDSRICSGTHASMTIWCNDMEPFEPQNTSAHGNDKNKPSWWRHQVEALPALLAICAGNSPITGEFPAQRPVTRSFDVFCDLRLNKRLNKQSRGRWFETPSGSLWRHCNDHDIIRITRWLAPWRGTHRTLWYVL